MVNPLQYRCEYLSPDQIYNKVDKFRKKYPNYSNLPINIECIIELEGLNIVPEKGLKDIGIDAYLSINAKNIYVDYDTYMDERYDKRLRFSFAHEMGHLILHNNIISQMHFCNSTEYNDYINGLPDSEYSRFEYQANEFG